MEYLEYYHKERRNVRLVDKRRSLLMRAVNVILVIAAKMKLASIGDFMGGYVTTIGRSIYSSPAWTWGTKVQPIVVHELTHVEQWSFMYALKYIFSSKFRMVAESICVQAEMLCYPDRFTNYEALESRAIHFVPYGINYMQALNILRVRAEEVSRGEPQPAAKRVHEVFRAWKTDRHKSYK